MMMMMRFCIPCCLMEYMMVSNSLSLVHSSASSTTNVVMPWMDFSLAVWLPLDVRMPRNMMCAPVLVFTTSDLVAWK